MNVLNWKYGWRSLALLPLLLMAACAGQPVTFNVDCPKPPSKPVARQPSPPQAYSVSAAQRIETWQEQLTATLPTSGNARQHGQGE